MHIYICMWYIWFVTMTCSPAEHKINKRILHHNLKKFLDTMQYGKKLKITVCDLLLLYRTSIHKTFNHRDAKLKSVKV